MWIDVEPRSFHAGTPGASPTSPTHRRCGAILRLHLLGLLLGGLYSRVARPLAGGARRIVLRLSRPGLEGRPFPGGRLARARR
eukprot:6634092-Pyramimonas_sp.AAC.1